MLTFLQAKAEVADLSTFDIFAGALANGDASVVFFNRDGQAASAILPLAELPGWAAGIKSASVRDVWAQAARAGVTNGVLGSGSVPSHGVAFLRVSKSKQQVGA